jgi:glycosyltransferase involved in cell wall biosynthesis
MRWLEWATIDLQTGLGGVEVHARHIAHELRRREIQVTLSADPRDLRTPWDVVHTHGSCVPTWPLPRGGDHTLRLHTLHGTTLGRMAACGEWAWPGGYLAAAREWTGVIQADLVLAVQPDLWLLSWSRRLGKHTAVCLNGWDSPSDARSTLPDSLQAAIRRLGDFWLFVGRADRVKGIDMLEVLLQREPHLALLAAPGEGFTSKSIVPTGRLGTSQVQQLCRQAAGLIVPSRYEGLPLVVLEALAQGTRVVAARAGGIAHLETALQPEGLVVVQPGNVDALHAGWRQACGLDNDEPQRQHRAAINRERLPTWSRVTETILRAVGACRPDLAEDVMGERR